MRCAGGRVVTLAARHCSGVRSEASTVLLGDMAQPARVSCAPPPHSSHVDH